MMDLKWLCLTIVMVVTATANMNPEYSPDAAGLQIVLFKNRTKGPIGTLTSPGGTPVEVRDTISLNKRLLYDDFFMDSMSNFVREDILPRVVHTKGGGAFGYFEVTHDLSDICKAKVFSKVGKKTPIAARFSPVFTERGGVDTAREPRGYAIKFYTEEGNFDMVGFNLPVVAIKDPFNFITFVRALKRNPATNTLDPNTLWDFVTSVPESINAILRMFGNLGIPNGYRHMTGFSVHTFQVVNNLSESHFVRFYFEPDQGIKFFQTEEAVKVGGFDPDYNTRDLYNAIGRGDFPSWTASVQVLTMDDLRNADMDVFDVTLDLPFEKYPLREFGRVVLNRNPVNYFAEMEQLAFSPANLIPGILGAPDKVFESRLLAYRDAENYRLGGNFKKIPVNCPLHMPNTYMRDGPAPVQENMRDAPNYYPNSFNGPVPYFDKGRVELIEIYDQPANNLYQVQELYKNGMLPEEKEVVAVNILTSLGPVTKFLQERAIDLFTKIHPDLGARIRHGLQANSTTP